MKFIIIGGVAMIILTVAKGLLPALLFFLPLGGSTIAEMGIVFGIAVAATTLSDLARKTHDKATPNGDD